MRSVAQLVELEYEISICQIDYSKSTMELVAVGSNPTTPPNQKGEKVMSDVEYYQTEDALHTVAIVKHQDGSISIGIARAGKKDIEDRRISILGGIEVATGRAFKANAKKGVLCDKNYLRAIHAKKITLY